MIKAYIERLSEVPLVPLLYPNFGTEERSSILFLNNAFKNISEPFVEVVNDPAQAAYLLIPHNYPSVRANASYLQKYRDLSEKTGKPILVIWHGDSDAMVDLPNATVLRTSQYGSALRSNEIMMPAYAEDLLADGSLNVRTKGEKPVVGFCGWARYKNMKNVVGTLVKDAWIDLRAMGNSNLRARKKGLRYRMKALKIFQKSNRITPNIVVRSSYSGHAQTIKMDPQQARREYIENMQHSDYALVVKGDGNYSYRFYEALSLGRIPVLLNTDCVLPLNDVIDYASFVLFVDYRDLKNIDRIIADFHRDLAPQEFEVMQKRAREAYENYLSVPAFFRYAVDHLL